MKTIYLQRQGSTDTFNTLNAINTDLGYYIEVKAWSDNPYNIIIVSTRKQDDDTKNKRIEITAVYLSLSDAFRRVEKELREELSEDATISDTIEKYCHNRPSSKGLADICPYWKNRPSNTKRSRVGRATRINPRSSDANGSRGSSGKHSRKRIATVNSI